MNYPLHPSFFEGWQQVLKDFLPSIIALVTAVIAGAITILIQSRQIEVARQVRDIAHRQSLNAETKLRLDLFQHRFKALQDVERCINKVLKMGGYKEEYHEEFAGVVSPMRYLFDETMHSFLQKDVRLRLQEFKHANEAYFTPGDSGDVLEARSARGNKAYFRLINALSHIEDLALPYLIIDQSEVLHLQKRENSLTEQEDQS